MEEELLSAANIGKSDDIELQEIMEKVMKGKEDLTAQFEGVAKSPRISPFAHE